MAYLDQHGTRETPQSEPIPGSTQVPNSAGGFVWAVGDFTRLRRFLILGSEGGSYYASERSLTTENAEVVRRLAMNPETGVSLVDTIVEISQAGRAPNNDPALYALAVAISHGDAATKRAAAEALPLVARIGTHLYHFVRYAETQRGWGRTLRWAVANWYLSKPLDKLAYDAIKYRQRDGWSHRDLLRVAHPDLGGIEEEGVRSRKAIFNWITHRDSAQPGDEVGFMRFEIAVTLQGFENAQRAESPQVTAKLVREYGLPREALKTDHLSNPEVWRALLDVGMPYHALTRNLANMTRLGVLDGRYKQSVIDRLGDPDGIRKSRLHPLAILVAQATYAQGRGMRGTNSWTPIPQITDALNDAFYLAFDNVEPTGKRILLALDVSPSMASGNVAGSPLSPREASAALALVALKTEPNCEVVAFAGDLSPLGLSARQRLDDAVQSVSHINWSHTDCALPMLWAGRDRREFDAFVIYTDNETFFGNVHPAQALTKYRNEIVPGAHLAVVGMVANDFSIADPADAGMLDVVGFDTATPAIVGDFIAGRV